MQITSKDLEYYRSKSNESSRNLDKISEENKCLRESVSSLQSNIDKIDRIAYGKIIYIENMIYYMIPSDEFLNFT